MAGDRVPATQEVVAQIAVPTLVMWGRDDNLVPVSGAQKFADAITGSDLVIYDNIGHLPQEENAAQSIEDVRTFMLDVEWNTLEDEAIIPAGDPRMTENRPAASDGN
jgi:pimeloyl-ACP methyl ester carboxylesterase